MLEIAIDELERVTKHFYTVTGIVVALYDAERHPVYSYPAEMNDICKCVRTRPELAGQCYACDNLGFDICDRTHEPYVYKCYMNMCEAIAPILENGIIIGYMMLGQVVYDGDQERVLESICEVAEKYGLPEQKMLAAFQSTKVVDEQIIDALVGLLSTCICYLYCNQIIRHKTDVVAHRLKTYIHAHLSEDLSVESLCRIFYLSRSSLYEISNKVFKMGISDYIRTLRLSEAKKLLKGTDKPVTEIAELVGFKDSSYFVRFFKAKNGITPAQYRKN